ncbi:hypothetical protein LCGC14_0754510 [marine sediment metagenome]|uniref:Response regulator receiver modulated diguanylate cyclase/phosphodiesterase with PAS/PAC sensor(S) n=1 Tax=marine sediment metagenome TaxID=412755 RepID=A0A0F9Q331_9ZZZZ
MATIAKTQGILRVLLVDSSLTDADVLINVLRSAGHAVRATREDKPAAIEKLLSAHTWDLMLCREHVPDITPFEVLELIKRLGRDLPCVVIMDNTDHEVSYLEGTAKDVVLFSDTQRLKFVVNREVDSLAVRRLARRNERALRESEKRARTLLDSSRDAVAYMHEGMHIYVNNAYLYLFGFDDADDVAGLPILDLFSAEDHSNFKSIFRQFTEKPESPPVTMTGHCLKSDGAVFEADIEFSHAKVEDEDCTQVVIRTDTIATGDVATLSLEEEVAADPAGLLTRSQFVTELEKHVHQAVDGQGDAQLLYLMLDDFQAIKSSVGLIVSETILRSVTELLENVKQGDEVLGYYGDYTFTIIIPSHDDSEVQARAEAYRQVIQDYVSHVSGKVIDLKCSIGIARINETQATAEAVLEQADKACTQAQSAGGNQLLRYHVAVAEIDQNSQVMWETHIRRGLENDSFKLYYQPIVALHGEPQQFYEVLLRLSVNDELIAADNFIQHAIQLNLMVEVDKWVIRQSLQSLAQHRQQHPSTRFFIKLSEQTLHASEFVDWLAASLAASSLNGNSLVFEISETVAVDNVNEAKKVIEQLQSLGCSFGLEHFGSGVDFSNSLNALNVDYLKINGAFVENMARDSENQAAVKAIIDMTKQAGKLSIAEFVSDANSLALLWRLGVDYAQGFYIQEPSAELNYDFDDDDG